MTMTSDRRAAPLLPGEAGLRRAVLIDPRPGRVLAYLEDDFHHFEIALSHDGRAITGVEATTIRHPWTTCAGAGPKLIERLTGVALADVASFDSPYAQCTHLYDLALFAASKAGGDRPHLFRMFVEDWKNGLRRAVIDRDGVVLIDWRLDRETVLPPHDHAGRSLRELRHWAAELPADEREAALLLRRAVFISVGRTFDPDLQEDVPNPPPGACFAHQPENFDPAARFRGSRRDFTHAVEGPLAARAAACA
nr:hypothetical protein [Sphingomonas laterariae]